MRMPTNRREYARKHYEQNKAKYIARAAAFKKKAVARNKKFLRGYAAEHGCADCGEDDWVVLEFDHVRGKKRGDLARMANQGVSIDTLKKEIAKCEVRCANCHRRVTHKRRQRS